MYWVCHCWDWGLQSSFKNKRQVQNKSSLEHIFKPQLWCSREKLETDLTTNIVESTMRVIGLHTIIEGENTPSKREWREPQGDSQGRSEKENSDGESWEVRWTEDLNNLVGCLGYFFTVANNCHLWAYKWSSGRQNEKKTCPGLHRECSKTRAF